MRSVTVAPPSPHQPRTRGAATCAAEAAEADPAGSGRASWTSEASEARSGGGRDAFFSAYFQGACTLLCAHAWLPGDFVCSRESWLLCVVALGGRRGRTGWLQGQGGVALVTHVPSASHEWMSERAQMAGRPGYRPSTGKNRNQETRVRPGCQEIGGRSGKSPFRHQEAETATARDRILIR